MMNKIILPATTLCLLLVGLVGCDAENYPSEDGLTFRATILVVHDDSVIVQTIEGMGFNHTTRVLFGTGELDDIGASVGDVVCVVFTGDILQTYPEQVFATSWSIVERSILAHIVALFNGTAWYKLHCANCTPIRAKLR